MTTVAGYIDEMSSLIIELVHDDAQPPRRATEGSAGYDLCAYLTGRTVTCNDGFRIWDAPTTDGVFALKPGVTALIPLGFRARLPAGIEAQIRPRSGTTFRSHLEIPNAPGTIDPDYPDEWKVIVRNPTIAFTIEVKHAERIAQMVLSRFETLPVEQGTVAVSTNRTGGFGSTGR